MRVVGTGVVIRMSEKVLGIAVKTIPSHVYTVECPVCKRCITRDSLGRVRASLKEHYKRHPLGLKQKHGLMKNHPYKMEDGRINEPTVNLEARTGYQWTCPVCEKRIEASTEKAVATYARQHSVVHREDGE